jgi:hypothetical protein
MMFDNEQRINANNRKKDSFLRGTGQGTREAFMRYDSKYPVKRRVLLSQVYPIVDLIDELIQDIGTFASSKKDVFGRLFGRDAAITAGFEVATHPLRPNPRLGRVINSIEGMCQYTAKRDVREAGIRKGSMIHEAGTPDEGYPAIWYVDEGGMGRNHDTLDGNGRYLNLIANIATVDRDRAQRLLPYVEPLTEWSIDTIKQFGGAAYVGAEYEGESGRIYPGITNKRWKDCGKSTQGIHPIYPVEEQGLYVAALQHAADMLATSNPALSREARGTAKELQRWFLDKFVMEDARGVALADALDGNQHQIKVVGVDEMLALAPSYNGRRIVDDPALREAIYDRAFNELFTRGGLRTVSPLTPVPSIYQGHMSLWPHAQGLALMALHQDAVESKKSKDRSLYRRNEERVIYLGSAMLDPIITYGSPIETVQLQPDGSFDLYRVRESNGKEQTSALIQAWTGAAGKYAATLLEKAYGVNEVSIPLVEQKFPPNGDIQTTNSPA